ncbi:TCR/Tet family MFS transporter [Rhodospirillum centenum]|uniref:Tetracycline resistance protein, class C n=1 Tax=Rhodospirillum centenum (strain ATCC 51521 / SW) TaxID=414684 RepID=B6INI9_RHOCS|nr:tetracycline resistance MFS efflux pump [Rhodospirillum centenum]ACI99086.1 tetracycline resistance protein, class C [Rhodospirillum centenum SW]
MSAHRAAAPFILVTLLLDVLAFGLAIPVMPELVRRLVGGDLDVAATWTGILLAGFSLMQFLFAPVLGALSDRFGRRPVLLASAIGTAVDHLIVAFSPTIWWLLAGRLLSGVTAASFTTCNAYIADVTPPEKRAKAFGMLGAAFGIGFVLGPLAGGLLGSIDPRLPFLAAAGLSFLSFLYGLFVLPESLRAEHRRAFSWRRANPAGSLKALARHPVVKGLAAANVCNFLAFGALHSVWVLSTTARFGWGSFENGLSLTTVGLATAFVQGALVGPLVAKLGDKRALIAGAMTNAAAYAVYALAPAGWVFLSGIALGALGGIAGPALQGIISRIVGADEQGSIQGAMASLNSLTMIVAPMIGSTLLAVFSAPGAPLHLPGMPFLFGAAMLVSAAGIAALTLRRGGGLPADDRDGGSGPLPVPDAVPATATARE